MPGPDKHMPCKDCPDRAEMGKCHDRCEAYLNYKSEIQKKNIFLMNHTKGKLFPPTVKYHKSSGCYRAPKGIQHKKSG